MSNIGNKIWYDFVNTKYGDEYLVLYLGRQKKIRKLFKIFTILFSASGIFSAAISAKIPTIISCTIITGIQLLSSIENFIILTENEIEKLSELRLLYYNRMNTLEQLWNKISNKKMTEDEASDQFFALRNSSEKIEKIDNDLNVIQVKSLKKHAETSTRNFLKTYYNE